MQNKLFLSFNYVSRKMMRINVKHKVYQQFTHLVTMYTTQYDSERFIIVPKQEDEALHPEWR